MALHALLDATPAPGQGVVVGGGYVGLEIAEALHTRGLHTTLIASRDGLLGGSRDPDMSAYLADGVRALGIEVEVGQRVARLNGREGTRGRGGVRRTRDRRGPGRPRHGDRAAARAGAGGWVAHRRERRGVGGRHQRTSAPGVYAAGDRAQVRQRVTGAAINPHLGTIANKQRRITGINIGGGNEAFPGVIGTAITRCHDLEVSHTGVTEEEARAAGMDPAVATFDATTMAGYWPASTSMRVRALADRATRRIIGGPTAAKRIDTIAMAIWNEMTVDAMVNVDLSYAPPCPGVWDPVLVAARKLQGVLDGAPDERAGRRRG